MAVDVHERVLAPAHGVTAAPLEGDAVLCHDYLTESKRIPRLYDKATSSQWRVSDLAWSTEIDLEQLVDVWVQGRRSARNSDAFADWSSARLLEYYTEWFRYLLSQILHGEQLALLASSRLTMSLPTLDAKMFAATQSADEARHVEFFSKYLDEKLGGSYPVGDSVSTLLRGVATDPRWDVLFLGTNVMLEGLALAAFGLLRRTISEPLLLEALHKINADEARHVAFGQFNLGAVYAELDAREIRERQEFAYDIAVGLLQRFEPRPIWEAFEFTDEQISVYRESNSKPTATILFSKVVPACARLGLLDAGDGWLRDRFRDIGIGFFAQWPRS